MRLRFDTSPADWEAFADFQLKHSPTLQQTVRKTRLIIAGGMVVLTILIWWFTRSPILLIGCVIGGAWGLYDLPKSFRKNAHKQMRALYEEAFPAGSNTRGLLEIRDDGLYAETWRGTSLLAWPALSVYDESPTHLYIGIGGPSGIVVPREGVTEGDVGAFAAALRGRIR